ncbi:inactive pancreatic lipase-related protein 1-like [Ylistrum balloti]|uniref:inactive pancreatic lipase-related protein 1-like n=1 Tax=Ylistrum balloti TaxID=509963 RepID=UPI002905CD80|nr:inactive pancreatic lipase-related protein 1-like [Ylistrum balloti]
MSSILLVASIIIMMATLTSGYLSGMWPWKTCKTACFLGFGCYSSEKPFDNTQGVLPLSPKKQGLHFLLYTRKNPVRARKLKWNSKRVKGKLNLKRDTIFLIHGWMDSAKNPKFRKMRKTLIRFNDVNVIAVNWKRGAGHNLYYQSAANTRIIAAMISKFLLRLQYELGYSMEKVHIIGHSLGAQMAGYIGTEVKGIGRISGIDPAGPSFEGYPPETVLDPTDANFVDILHTDARDLFVLGHPGFGAKSRMGHADFYVNGGHSQPGCPSTMNQQLGLIVTGSVDVFMNMGCSHIRAVNLYIESINIRKCKFTSYNCTEGDGLTVAEGCNTCENGCALMGYHSNVGNPRGVFVLNTNDKAPFCITEAVKLPESTAETIIES